MLVHVHCFTGKYFAYKFAINLFLDVIPEKIDLTFKNCDIKESDISTRPRAADTQNWGTDENVYQPTFYRFVQRLLTSKNDKFPWFYDI